MRGPHLNKQCFLAKKHNQKALFSLFSRASREKFFRFSGASRPKNPYIFHLLSIKKNCHQELIHLLKFPRPVDQKFQKSACSFLISHHLQLELFICVRKCHHLYDITFLSVAMLLFFPRFQEFPMEKEQLFFLVPLGRKPYKRPHISVKTCIMPILCPIIRKKGPYKSPCSHNMRNNPHTEPHKT